VSSASLGSDQFNSYVLCRNQKDVRTIRVEKNKSSNIWVAYYTKLGVDKEVARAQTLDSCTKVVENIKDNLTKANWKCKDLQKVSSSTTSLNE
jgi:hypothetical protein